MSGPDTRALGAARNYVPFRFWLDRCSPARDTEQPTARGGSDRRRIMCGALRTIVVVPAAVALLASGCATKDFVREMVGKSEQEMDQRVGTVNERVVTVEGRLGEETQRVTKVEGQLAGVETKVGQVGEQVKAAQTRADAAYGRADEVDSRLTRLWTNRHQRQLVETLHVQFGFDRADLTDGAQTALLTIVKELKSNPGLTVELEGYTDPSGPKDYNVTLSQRRVESVRRYLIEQGAELPRIHSVGLGPLAGKGDDAAKQRRVTVKLMIAAE
jgi:outer membrane protein OmpA-like peptidoglycan-associated protein